MSISGDNVLQRIIRLVLDHASAKKVDDEIADHAKHAEKSWKETAMHIAEAFGVVFVLEKMREFGSEAVKEAAQSQAAWEDLQVSIENTGASFVDMKDDIREMADALRDATGKDDDQFVQTLARLVTLTGDTTASMNNMALTANVAAKFFRGDLEPATQLVAKAMNGNVLALKRLGITAKDGQEALDILSQRSMGAAEARMHTFAGQTESLETAWKDLLKALGFAVIESGGATSALDVLRAAVKTLTEWVERNKDEIGLWVTNGVAFAIDSTDVLIRAVKLLNDTFFILVDGGLAAVVEGYALFAEGNARAAEAALALRIATGRATPEEAARAVRLRQEADAYIAWADSLSKARKAHQEAAKEDLTKPLFSSEQFKNRPKSSPLPGENNRPMVGKNEQTESTKEVTKAIEEYEKSVRSALNMQEILGDSFDAVGAEIDRTSKLLNVLAANGVDPASRGFDGLQDRLALLTKIIKPTQDATKALAKTMGEDTAMASVTMSLGVDQATTNLDLLKQKQAAVGAAMKKFDTDALRSTDAYKDLTLQYQRFSAAIADETKIQAAIDANRELAKSFKQDLAVGMLTGVSALDQLKKQQQSVLEAFNTLVKAGVDPASAAAQQFVIEYNNLTTAIEQAENIKRTADAYRDLGDAIRASVFEESVHAITKVEMLKKQQDALGKAMLAARFNKDANALRELEQRYAAVTKEIQVQTEAMRYQATIADFLAEALGQAMQGGIGKAAAIKAKQMSIEAAEMAIRAIVFAAFGNFPAAGAAAKAAVEFGALALAWAGLSAAAGGSGGGGSAPVPTSSGGSVSNNGEDLTQARASNSRATSGSTTPSAEVSIYMVGPGFNALNPQVQRVVWGAQQEARQRFGNDAVIRLRSTGE